MKSCWESKPDSRPPFSRIVTTLVHFLGSIADYFDLVLGNPATQEESHEIEDIFITES